MQRQAPTKTDNFQLRLAPQRPGTRRPSGLECLLKVLYVINLRSTLAESAKTAKAAQARRLDEGRDVVLVTGVEFSRTSHQRPCTYYLVHLLRQQHDRHSSVKRRTAVAGGAVRRGWDGGGLTLTGPVDGVNHRRQISSAFLPQQV